MRATYTVVLTPSVVGGWVVEVPALPGCVTEGDSVDAALDMVQDAIEGYLAVLQEDGDRLPVFDTPAAVLETCEEGGVHTWSPSLPGCHSEGESAEEACRNFAEAASLYLEPDREAIGAYS